MNKASCKHVNVKEIRYGLISSDDGSGETEMSYPWAKKKDIELGGCCVSLNSPTRVCKDCNGVLSTYGSDNP
jgi:hypothetical protein